MLQNMSNKIDNMTVHYYLRSASNDDVMKQATTSALLQEMVRLSSSEEGQS